MQAKHLGSKVLPLFFGIAGFLIWNLGHIQQIFILEWQKQAESLQDRQQICAMFSHKYQWFACSNKYESMNTYSKCNYIKQKQQEFHCRM